MKIEQILTSNYPYARFSLDYALDSLERMGSERIEFYAVYPHFHIDDVGYADFMNLKKKIKNHNLSVSCLTPEQCLYPVNIAAKDVSARKRSIEVFQKSIQYGSELGADTVVVLAGYGTLDEDERFAWARSVESLGILGDFAETCGVNLVLETAPRAYTTTHNAQDVVRMIKEVGVNSIKGMIDTATLGFSNEKMEDAIATLGDSLCHVHVADGVPNGHLILGEGVLDIEGMMKSLDEVGYDKALSLEILNDKYMCTPHEAMERSFQILKNMING